MPVQPRRSPRTIAAQQRQRDANRDRRRAITSPFQAASDFENEMRSLCFEVCSTCNKRTKSSQISRSQCATCRRSSINLFSTENGMNIGDIPGELRGLSMIEELLIARVHPVVSVFRIRGQQRAYSGHVMNFVQHIENVAVRLPHNLRNLNSVVLLDGETPNGLVQFRVRSGRVRDALIWLKQNNQYYTDVIIDDELLNQLPVDGDVSQLLPSIDSSISTLQAEESQADNIISASCFPNLPAVDADDIIQRNLRQASAAQSSQPPLNIGAWPDLSQQPLNEFRNEGIICKAFPVLFPYGRGDLHQPRLHKIHNHKYFKYLMQYKDGRFASDMRFPYYAYNSLARWDALNCGNVYVRFHAMEGMTAEDMLEVANNPDRNIAASIMYYGANLRGTRAFWKQRCSELIQMIRQLGIPTIFFTLSAADYHWPDLFRIISPDVDPNSLDERQRRLLMHDNPATVAWFFDQRCDIFMKKFMTKVFNVKDYWYRYEWQHRGSPHIHGLLWLDPAPDCDDIGSLDATSRNRIVQYFDRLISATLREEGRRFPAVNPCRTRFTDIPAEERAQDLEKLLSAVQRHSRCGVHCMRRKRGSRNLTCRYRFPMQLEDQSSLRFEDGAWKFIPQRDDPLITRHNRLVTQVWRGNTDFSAITSKDAVIAYISKYASKGEYPSETFSELLRRVINRNPSDAPAATLVRQLLVSSVAERNYSAQEVMHLLLGWPLYHASRTIIVLALRDDWRRLVPTSNTMLARYATRDAGLLNVSLFNYAKKYRHERDRTIERQKECIVRVIPYLKEPEENEDGDEYYKLQCKLHMPWHGNFEDILPPNTTWADLYLANQRVFEESDDFGDEIPAADELEFENDDDDENEIVRDAAMAASRLHPRTLATDPLGHRPIDEAFEWETFSQAGISELEINQFIQTYRSVPIVGRTTEQVISYALLSTTQKQVLDITRQQLCVPQFQHKRVIVQGKAGTGKSAVIKTMCHLLDGASRNLRTYQVLAPTGAAAVNIDGKTIHSFLRIPINGPLQRLNGESLRNFQLQFRGIKFIIIDEYSMIGLRLLNKIHLRLGEANGNIQEPFGGFFIYLFGDLRQLPPVRDIPIYMPSTDDFSTLGSHLVATFTRKIILSVTYRQTSDQQEFKEVLDSLGTGTISTQGWEFLMRRRECLLSASEVFSFKDAVHLFSTNAKVQEHNNLILSSNRSPVALIEGIHNNAIARQASDLLAGGLSRRLYLSIGCRIMLRKNLCVERGLVNGSMGTVRKIIYNSGQGPPSLPFSILIEFDKYTGPFLQDALFPIMPVVSTWKENSVDCSRRQFPINVAYALTIHKAQGLTLDKVKLDIGARETAAGLTYVAFSRVRRVEDLITLPFDYSRVNLIAQMRHVQERETFLRIMEHTNPIVGANQL